MRITNERGDVPVAALRNGKIIQQAFTYIGIGNISQGIIGGCISLQKVPAGAGVPSFSALPVIRLPFIKVCWAGAMIHSSKIETAMNNALPIFMLLQRLSFLGLQGRVNGFDLE
jgi:hypothetical protein